MTPSEMNQAVILGLPAKTGKSLEEWLSVMGQSPASDRKGHIAWLKSVHGLGHVTASIIVDFNRREAHVQLDPNELVDKIRSACSAEAQGQLDAVLVWASNRPDVSVVPCKGYVGIQSGRQFAALRARGGRLEIGVFLDPAACAFLHEVRGLGGGKIRHGVWGDEAWLPVLEAAYRASLSK